MIPTNLLVLLLCYAIGCFVTAWYLVRWRMGADLRVLHSGTTGARNAGRVLGRAAFAGVAVLDGLRGMLALGIAAHFGLRDWWLTFAGTAVLAGHVWPVQTGFQGGKGLAIGTGVILWLLPLRSASEWTPVDLRRVYLAASTSGKGLAAIAGIGIVFHREPAAPAPDRVPRALDLGLYASEDGVPFTLGSNVLGALHTSLHQTDWPAKYQRVQELGTRLSRELCARGLTLADPAATAVITVVLPPLLDVTAVADALERLGWIGASRSRHLHERGWLQLCLLGEIKSADLDGLVDALVSLLPSASCAASAPRAKSR